MVIVTLRSEVIGLEKRKPGRPTDNPKTMSVKFLSDAGTFEKLKECSEKLEVSRAEIIRMGIHRIYEDLQK